MRKILAFVLTLSLLLFVTVVIADTDFTNMSYDELVELNRSVIKEIMSRPEWKEVEIPAGQYTIGVDIPAGVYSVTPKDKGKGVYLRWYPNPDSDYWDYNHFYDVLGRFEFYDGMRIYTEEASIFAPPLALGF